MIPARKQGALFALQRLVDAAAIDWEDSRAVDTLYQLMKMVEEHKAFALWAPVFAEAAQYAKNAEKELQRKRAG